MRAKIDINEVEVRTKIRAKYLRAIENEEWDLLPGEVYAKSFLRTYGEFLGLDTRQLIDDFRRRYESPPDQELRPIAPLGSRERERHSRGPLLPPWLIVGVVLIVVVVGARSSSASQGNSNPPPPTHPVATDAGPPDATAAIARPRAGPSRARSSSSWWPTGQVYVCLVNGAGQGADPGADLQRRPDDPGQDGAQAAAHARQQFRDDEGQRQDGPGHRLLGRDRL